jgi:asparagine synthase (glutamine-hydrolysing)
MRAFLCVSLAPGAAERLRRPLPEVLECLADADTVVDHVEETADGWLAGAGSEAEDLVSVAGGPFTVRLSRAVRTRLAGVPTADLGELLATGSGLTELLPPFAAAHRPAVGAPVVVAGDWLGFRQLYRWTGPGIAAVSTSARALAALAGGGFDPAGLGAQALIGWQIGDATVFPGVRVLPPATIATLGEGRLTCRQYAAPPARPAQAPDLDDAVAEMADILRAFESSYLDQHPDTVLQLTGGHDSRILLAALPPEQRAGLRTLTLGSGRSADVRIAAELSRRYGLRHQVHSMDEQRWPEPQEAHQLALAAARALECQASPLALAPLLLAESHLEQGHRLSGLGGEVARGFYYAGQPATATTSPHLVERLARWRLFSNEAVTPEALDPAVLAAARESTLERLNEFFAPGDWLRATDEFYLLHRMHRWAGVHGTVAAVRRHFVNPMFDRRFIELALAVAPADKRDSQLLGRLMTRLDTELAAVPLDTGLVPAALGTRSLRGRVATRTVEARKVVSKVGQRLTRGRRPQLGATEYASLVLAHWRAEPKSCAGLYTVPVLRHDWLDGLLSGGHDADATTVAFLINVLAAGGEPAA